MDFLDRQSRDATMDEPEVIAKHNDKTVSDLTAFFKPGSVAIIGASSDPQKPGNRILKNLLSMGYGGKVYPVNPNEKAIDGIPCVAGILEIPEPVDLCVLIVPADHTIPIARELVLRKERYHDVTAAICMSSGFGELNTDDAKYREAELVDVLRSGGIRLIGPNCLGIMDTYSRFNTNFDIGSYPRGGLSLLTQSGAFANSFLFWAESLHMTGLSKFVSIGNMADVDMSELLLYLRDDDSTRVIGIYLEGVPNPRDFFEIARTISAVKPIVALKSGKSDIGSAAALSHTGAVAGKDAIYDGAFKQAGIIRAKSVLEFYNTLRALERQPLPEGKRVCVLTHMGGPGTICLDEIASAGILRMAEFSSETREKLRSICAPSANIGSPDGYIDLTAAHHEKLHNQVLKTIFRDDNVDMVLQLLAPSSFIDQKLLVREITEACRSQEGKPKPLLNAVTFGRFAMDTRLGLENAGIPTFEHPDILARVAGNIADYAMFRRKAGLLYRERTELDARPSRDAASMVTLVDAAIVEKRCSLTEPEAYRICEQYGIPFPPFRVEHSIGGAIRAARKIGYPVVLKVSSREILHKSDVGGVVTGITSDSSFRDACFRLRENLARNAPDVKEPELLIQKQMPPASELILGAVREESFGPVVMFGLGGIYVEALKFVGFRLSPLCMTEARDLIRRTLPPAFLEGLKGRVVIHVESIAQALVALGRMMDEVPGIREIDLNPTLSYKEGCSIVDARIILSAPADP